MCLEHDLFRQLLTSSKFAQNICAIIVDEAHKFRPIYSQLGTLRAFVAANVPFLVTSATLPPFILDHVYQTMHMTTRKTYHVNLGTDRPNIAWFSRTMKGGKSDLESLAFLIPERASDDTLVEEPELTQTMVFFDDINLALQALKYLRGLLPESLRSQIALSPESKVKDKGTRGISRGKNKDIADHGGSRHGKISFLIFFSFDRLIPILF